MMFVHCLAVAIMGQGIVPCFRKTGSAQPGIHWIQVYPQPSDVRGSYRVDDCPIPLTTIHFCEVHALGAEPHKNVQLVKVSGITHRCPKTTKQIFHNTRIIGRWSTKIVTLYQFINWYNHTHPIWPSSKQ